MTIISDEPVEGWRGAKSKVEVNVEENEGRDADGSAAIELPLPSRKVNMRVNVVTATFAVVIWGFIVIMNVALLVLLGLGKT